MHKFPNGEIAYEGVINRDIAREVVSSLRKKGYNAIYSVHPEDHRDVPLSERVKTANSYDRKSTYYISIHNNAAPNPGTARGFEIFTSPGKTESDELADWIFLEVKKLYDRYGLKMRYDLSDGDWDKEARFYELINTRCPAVLLECLFFDNYEDYKMLKNPLFISQLGEAISEGIIKHIQSLND